MPRPGKMQVIRLTQSNVMAKGAIMTRKLCLLTLVAAAALAGCNNEDHTIVAGGPEDPMANQLANAAPVELPPSIVASHQYRCKDNSLVSIDWLSDGKTNSARATPQGGAGVQLAQAEADGPYTGGGTTLTGDPKAESVTYKGQSCKR